ncbi:MAG: hypothetical protein IJ224_04690 [Lachnospiraceae bacterium]|nr:hypothetical protein [Lachnospiraceae bacterium]
MIETKVIRKLQDLTYLTWDKTRHSSGTAGSYLKSYEIENNKKLYYKLSCYDSLRGITGHECVNEIIVDRLLSIMGLRHLNYQLLNARIVLDDKEYETYLCVSEDYKNAGDSKTALDDYYDMEKNEGESILDFCERMGWIDYIYEMLVVDFLIINRDRHGANIEVIRNKYTGDIGLAPLFDHGLSLVYSCGTEKEVEEFDSMRDIPVQCYVGSKSAYNNLNIIPKSKLPKLRRLDENDREYIFKDLQGILPNTFYDKIWEIIWNRWKYYEDMCYKG